MGMSAEAVKQDQEKHPVEISVNKKAVTVQGPKATGLQIKEAAIAQGVRIELTFQLSEEFPGHKAKIIGDSDVVTVHKGSIFVAVAGDDNS
jgi:hypothetical protein